MLELLDDRPDSALRHMLALWQSQIPASQAHLYTPPAVCVVADWRDFAVFGDRGSCCKYISILLAAQWLTSKASC